MFLLWAYSIFFFFERLQNWKYYTNLHCNAKEHRGTCCLILHFVVDIEISA